MEELDAAIAADRDALGKKPFEKKDDDELPTTQIQQSKNDPESGQLHKEGKPDGFHYSEHRTVDSKNNIPCPIDADRCSIRCLINKV